MQVKTELTKPERMRTIKKGKNYSIVSKIYNKREEEETELFFIINNKTKETIKNYNNLSIIYLNKADANFRLKIID